jgi:hypothetical protein
VKLREFITLLGGVAVAGAAQKAVYKSPNE